jgi:hypothetical protein
MAAARNVSESDFKNFLGAEGFRQPDVNAFLQQGNTQSIGNANKKLNLPDIVQVPFVDDGNGGGLLRGDQVDIVDSLVGNRDQLNALVDVFQNRKDTLLAQAARPGRRQTQLSRGI